MQRRDLPQPTQQPYHAGSAPLTEDVGTAPDGALISGDPADEGKIAVVYNRGEAPPEITISETGGPLQTVLANGIAVAIVARADGPRLTLDDILLIERYVAPAGA